MPHIPKAKRNAVTVIFHEKFIMKFISKIYLFVAGEDRGGADKLEVIFKTPSVESIVSRRYD